MFAFFSVRQRVEYMHAQAHYIFTQWTKYKPTKKSIRMKWNTERSSGEKSQVKKDDRKSRMSKQNSMLNQYIGEIKSGTLQQFDEF